jgi:hypothetical protein
MILNVIDKRNRPHRWQCIDAIVEATFHDNTVQDADQAETESETVDYADLIEVSVADAIAWASKFEGGVTLYLYDVGSRIAAHE